ncbi:hypothetical protein HIM_04116 [Hirsutella minnesotensis 3608]|uniref:Uncharacterized protein n=1 Tax=Hirsutella minnesotensis 3608 TaxID=1043627 RepID=A0A0F8A1P7_9HYPO|nr:hypothetical protein HIM_04116 [Hirsutella minnesotensis 3608]
MARCNARSKKLANSRKRSTEPELEDEETTEFENEEDAFDGLIESIVSEQPMLAVDTTDDEPLPDEEGLFRVGKQPVQCHVSPARTAPKKA